MEIYLTDNHLIRAIVMIQWSTSLQEKSVLAKGNVVAKGHISVAINIS